MPFLNIKIFWETHTTTKCLLIIHQTEWASVLFSQMAVRSWPPDKLSPHCFK